MRSQLYHVTHQFNNLAVLYDVNSLDKLISSLSSGDEKIFNSDGTKIEINDQNTAAPSFSSQFFPPPGNYSANDPYFAWRGMYGNAYNQPSSFDPETNNPA
jgi:hypothetical protein